MRRPARPRLAAAVLGVFAISCAADRPADSTNEDRTASLGGQIVARVGDQTIPLSLVADVATAQRIAPREAAQKLIDDAVAAEAARARSLDRRAPAAWRLVSARARFTSARLLRGAKHRGPPSPEEIELLSERHWAEVDRPPSFRVIHAIVLRPKDEALSSAARDLATILYDAVAAAKDRDDFEARAKAVPHDAKLEIRVEDLPPFTADGRIPAGGGQMDEDFARAAAALPAVDATSSVVETPFGWHVIRLLERLPERRMPTDARRIAFREEAYTMRAKDGLRARLDALRTANPVSIAPASEQLMRSVTFAPPGSVTEP